MHTIDALALRLLPWTTAAIVSHLWQSTVVGLVILGLMFCARRLSARTRWTLGWVALLKFVIPMAWLTPHFATVSPNPSWHQATSPDFQTQPSAAVAPAATALPPLIAAPVTAKPAMSPKAVVLSIWLAGSAAAFSLWIVRGMFVRRRILSEAHPISAVIKPWIARASARAGLSTLPNCIAVTGTAGPGVFGIFSPVIVLPESLESSLFPAELESILIHECVHFRRRDTLWAGLQAVLGCLFWFNPVVWLLNRLVTAETEKACDEEVLEITSDPMAYAGGIIKAIRQALGLQLPGFAGAGTLPVLSRIQNILSHRPGAARRPASYFALGAAVLVVAFSGFSGALAQDASARTPGKVLIFRNIPSWNRHPDFEEILNKLGFPFDVKRSRAMKGTDLSAYRVVVIPGAQWRTDYYQDFADAAADFDRWVLAGGTLVLEMNGAEQEGMTLPGGATMVKHPCFNNLIVMPDHPALAPFVGKPVITADLASHGYIKDVPKDALVLAVEMAPNQITADTSKPTYVEYSYGKGRIIAACQCFHDRDNSGRGPLMPAVLKYAMAGNWYSPK